MSLPLVEVVWCDSFIFEPSWHDVDDLPDATIVHRAVGYVVSEEKQSDDEPTVLMLAATISEDGTRAAGIVAIPHPAIFFRKEHKPLDWEPAAPSSKKVAR